MTDDTPAHLARKLILAAGLSGVMFWAISLGTASHSGLAFVDEPVSRYLATHRSDVVVSTARTITSLGVGGVLLPAAVITGVVLLLATRSVPLAVTPWLSVQLTVVLVSALKRHFGTARPPVAEQIIVVRNPAFPSGHAADTVAFLASVGLVVCIALVRSRRHRTWVVLAVAVAGGSMAATRLVLNVHWLSDAVGGACLGFAVAALCTAGGVIASSRHRP